MIIRNCGDSFSYFISFDYRPFPRREVLNMKRAVLSLLVFIAAGWIGLISSAVAQEPIPITQPLHAYYTHGQLRGMTTDDAVNASMTATTVPMGAYSVTSSRDGNVYQGAIVGRSFENHGARTTNVPTFIVPVKITIGTSVFDPGVADSTCLSGKVPTTVAQNSPIFQSAPFTMNGVSVGTTQYTDAFLRAEFWQNVSVTQNRFHTMLSPVTVLAEQSFTVPAGEGAVATGGCEPLGIMDIATWDSFVQSTLVPFVTAHGGGTTSFPFFLLYNVVMVDPFLPGSPLADCCILGYHSAFTPGGNIQTYGVGDFDSTGGFSGTADISALSHEVGEWMNDPTGGNATPAWGGIGQVGGCQGNFEVGDPLSGTLFPSVTLSSFTYHPQELAFFSWFYGTPSLGSGGKFSNNGKFSGDAKTCPPGGTN
jgi:hypothetical protein